MPKTQTFKLARPLTAEEIADVDKNAKERLDGYKSAFPREVHIYVGEKSGRLPALKPIPGFEPASPMYLTFGLDPLRLSPEVTAEMLEGFRGSAGAESPTRFQIEAQVVCRDREVGFPRSGTDDVTARMGLSEGVFWVAFEHGCYLLGTEDGNFKGADLNRRIATQRRNNREDLGRLIEAGRLPIRLGPDEDSVALEATGDPERFHCRKPDKYGSTWLQIDLPGDSPEQLARRFHDILSALSGPTPPEVYTSLSVGQGDRKVDPCPAVYKYLRDHPWPATSWSLQVDLRMKSARAAEGLRSFTKQVKAGFKLPFGQWKLEARKSAKLTVQVKADGHHLALQLPADHATEHLKFGRMLGVAFVG